MLELKDITVVLSKGTVNEKKVFDNLSLTINDGDFVTIIGSNGAGKSTLFNSVCGNVPTMSGSIILDGEDITYLPEHKRAKKIVIRQLTSSLLRWNSVVCGKDCLVDMN